MIIERIREFMLTCPYLEKLDVNINCLGGQPVCCSVEQSAAEPIVKTYCDGGTLRQCRFIFAVRNCYDEVTKFNAEAARLIENVEAWIEEQNSAGILPDLGNENVVPEKIEVTASGAVYESNIDTARLQLEARLLYRQKK